MEQITEITAPAEVTPAVATEAAANPVPVQPTVDEEAEALINSTPSIEEWMDAYVTHAKAGNFSIPNPTKRVAKFPSSMSGHYDQHAGLGHWSTTKPAQSRDGKVAQAILKKAHKKHGKERVLDALKLAVRNHFDDDE